MKSLLILYIVLSISLSQDAVSHEITLSNLSHHEIQIKTTFPKLKQEPLNIVMSRTSPGRYALHEFSKNIYSVSFANSDGDKLNFERPNLHEWIIPKHDGEVIMTYTLFGDRADGTYSGIDETHLHLNIPATFVWARGLEKRKVIVSVPQMNDKKWKYAGQLQRNNKTTFSAPNLYYFMDSPIEISNHVVKTWEINGQKINLAAHTNDTKKRIDEYAKMGEAVTLEQEAVFGELPKFDYGEYTFLADYLPHVNGDGMEHRNSTILTSTGSLENPNRVLGTLSHEFFHAWNVERIRPKSLEPFNFEDANVSGELWFAEGFTSYYDGLFIKRAGLISLESFLGQLNYPINKWVNGPGSGFYSAVGMSKQAPFVDAAKSVDPQNKSNTFISYYTFGNALGIYLDLEIRSKYAGKSLDGYMKSVWVKHGKPELPYKNKDLENVLGEYLADNAYAKNFFNNYIYGQKTPDYKPVLNQFGLELSLRNKNTAWLGNIYYREKDGKVTVGNSTIINTPIYSGGLEKGDQIVSLDNTQITKKDQIKSFLKTAKQNQQIKVVFVQRGIKKTAHIKLKQDPSFKVVTYESINKNASDDKLNRRNDWLAPRSSKSNKLIEKQCTKCKRTFPYAYQNCFQDGKTLEPKII